MIDLSYNGKTFNQRESDGYVNLGQLCATHGKKFSEWKRLKSTPEYLRATAETLTQLGVSIPTPENLVISDTNTIGGSAGTWGHPLVAIEVARWISPSFGVWCNQHIKQLIETGITSIPEKETHQPAPLPIRDTIDYINAANTLETLRDSMLKTLLADSLVDELALRRNNSVALLPPKNYTIVKVRAKMLGYTEKEIGNGARLGAFVHKRIKPAFQEVVGRYPVYHYEITPELDTAIYTFFGASQE